MPKPLLLLTRNRFLYASRRIADEAAKRGIDCQIADPRSIVASIGGEISTNIAGTPNVALRFGAASRGESLHAARCLEASGLKVVNSAASAALASSKVDSSLALAKASVATLESRVIQSSTQLEKAVSQLGGYPIVAKRDCGQKGEGVFLLESERSAKSLVSALLKEGFLILQRFVAEADGADARYLVLGGGILAGVMREGVAGDFRANFHQGAMLTPWMEEESANLALQAAQSLGLEFAGVDVISTNNGLRVLEVNASAGFRGVEEACNISVAGAIVEHICAE